jgi:hypothetical protein
MKEKSENSVDECRIDVERNTREHLGICMPNAGHFCHHSYEDDKFLGGIDVLDEERTSILDA